MYYIPKAEIADFPSKTRRFLLFQPSMASMHV